MESILVGCLLFLAMFVIIGMISVLWAMFLAKLVLIISMGIFHYSLVAQYWYVVLAVWVIDCILGSRININKKD